MQGFFGLAVNAPETAVTHEDDVVSGAGFRGKLVHDAVE